jgi:hypothetical protein
MTGFVDGQSLGTLAINDPTKPTTITTLDLYTQYDPGAAQDSYFDNVSLNAVPDQPSILVSAAILLVPGAIAIKRLRKKLSAA